MRANAGVDGDQSFGRRGRRVHPQDNVADPEDASVQCTQGAEGAGGASAQLTRQLLPYDEEGGASGVQDDRDAVDDVLGSIESIVGDAPRAR